MLLYIRSNSIKRRLLLSHRTHKVSVAFLLLFFIISSTVQFPDQALVSCNPGAPTSESGTIARYSVEITPAGATQHKVSVTAVLPVNGTADLTVSSPTVSRPTGDYGEQWVAIERCYDGEGRTVSIEQIDNRTWRVTSMSGVIIEYTARVDIPNPMAVGTYQTYLSENCGLVHARSVLLATQSSGMATVNFVLPEGWTVITDETWTQVNSTAYNVNTSDFELFAPGKWDVYNGTFGDGQKLRVAICGATKYDKGSYLNGIKTCLDYFHKHIGKLPQKELNVVLAELPIPIDYISHTPRLAVNRAASDWGMFEGMLWHYWFLTMVSYDTQYDSDRAWWFGEAASPFLLYPVYEAIGGASDVASAWGFKYNNLTWKNWYVVYEQYVGTKYNIPLVDYPAKNRETSDVQYYFPLPYMKGFLVLQMLNLSMVEVTHGAKDMRDVVKYIYENYVVKGIGYRIEDVLSAVNTVSGNDYTAFFDAYVYGNEILPIVEKGGDYLFDWSTLGDKTYRSLANTEKVRPTPQYWGGQIPEGETATLLEMRKESQHFTVYFHQQDAKMAALLLLDSEKAYDADTKIYGGEERLKIKMFLTYNSTEYAILGGNPSHVYGEDTSAGGVAVEAGDEINWLRPIGDRTQTQMYDVEYPIHELGHALLRQIYPNVYKNWEQWFDEGMPLAMMAWLESSWAPERYSPFRDHEPLRQLQSALMGGSHSVIPLSSLAKMDYSSLNFTEQLLFRGEGTTFHFYIASRYDNGLQGLLIEYNRNVPLATAVERAFGISYADLEKELWATAERAALHVNSADAIISRISREGVDTSLAEELEPEEPFLALLVAYALETRAGAGPEHLHVGTLTPGTTVKLSLNTTPITSLTIASAQRAENLSITIGEIDSDEVAKPPSGSVYCYVNMNCSSAAAGPVTIAFRVESSWISQRDLDPSTVLLLRLTQGVWIPLPTNMTGKDGSYYYFSAVSPGFSLFAVNASKSVPVAVGSTTIDCWVSPSLFGSPTTFFLVNESIYPTVQNTDGGSPIIRVVLLDLSRNVLVDRSYNVPYGLTGFGDYNPQRALATGNYTVEVWNATVLLKSIPISVSTTLPPANQTTTNQTTPTNQTTSRCIIATATYDSEMAPQVQFLRGFRDGIVMKTFAGSSFMILFNAWYYSWSPPVAAFISPNDYFKAAMRIFLQPLLNILQTAAAAFSLFTFNGELGIVVAGLVASTLIGIVYFMPITTLILILATKRGSVPRVGRIRLLAVAWAASLSLILLGELTSSSLLMMGATGAFVVFTIAVVAGAASLKIARYLGH